MTLPRRILPGQTLLVTRRCARRCFFFKPTTRALKIMAYCLAHAVSRFSVQIHALFWSTTHYHLVLTDPLGELPAFMHCLDTNLARSMNAHLGRGESFFAPDSYSKVELATTEAVLEKLVYVSVQAVKDGLVRRPERWPGIHSLAADLGKWTFTAERPNFYFRSEGTKERPALPEVASFEVTIPPGFEDMTPDAFRAMLSERVEAELQAIYARRKAEGRRRFMGVRAVMAQNARDAAGDVFPKFEQNPTIACGRGQGELRAQLLRQLTAWRGEYRRAWERWRRGEGDVVFPAGTYQMRVFYFVRSGTSPPALAA